MLLFLRGSSLEALAVKTAFAFVPALASEAVVVGNLLEQSSFEAGKDLQRRLAAFAAVVGETKKGSSSHLLLG